LIHTPSLAAILCGAAFNFFLGALWYGVLFTKPWLATLGITLADIEDAALSKPRAYLASAVLAIVLAGGTSILVGWLDARTWLSGALAGALGYATFNFTTLAKLVFFEDRPIRLFLINAGYDAISAIALGALLAVWR
jgi:hypothetical protein